MAVGYHAERSFSTPAKLEAFLQKNYMPIAGGVSNVNMNRSWPAAYLPACMLLDYIRVAPTGPMVPVVIAATTIGETLTFTLTRRGSLIDTAGSRGQNPAQTFIDELTARARRWMMARGSDTKHRTDRFC